MAEKTNRLKIYLVKPELTEFDEIVKPGTTEIVIPDVGTFYMQDTHARRPDWVADFFGDSLEQDLRLMTASAKGLLLVRVPDGDRTQIFAVTFGHGRHLLRDSVIEERFGLKVVLNSVLPDSLRSIDKTSLGSVAKHSREQISHEGGASSFGIDIEQDLVSSVTGRSAIEQFGRVISGKDSFSISAKFDVSDISDLLALCLAQYRSDAYKEDYDWIDQIRELRSRDRVAALNNSLVNRIQVGDFERVWLVPPEIIDWADVKGFRYARPKKGKLHADLAMTELIATAGDKAVTLEWLKKTKIHLISAKTDDVHTSWPALRCLYAEIELNGTVYVLNNAKWYEVAVDFTVQVHQDFMSIPESQLELPAYSHQSEFTYNQGLAVTIDGSCCLDSDLIYHGGGKSSIEFCDVLTQNKELLHVKRYSGSAQLSHLFAQAVVSAELFVSDAAFRAKLNEKLPEVHQMADVSERPDPIEYEIVFVIISKSEKPLDIPFFSKVSLRNAHRRLRGYGYRVAKKKVLVQPAN